MMKRNILAVVIPALLVAGATNAAEVYNKNGNKVDLYGKIDGRHFFSKNPTQNGDATYYRLGIQGETQISNQLTGYGQFETEVDNSQVESNTAGNEIRVAFAGIRYGDWGSLDYGRNYGVLYDLGAWTDVLPEFGGDSYGLDDNFMAGRSSNLLTYRDDDFFGLVNGLHFALQYQGKNEANDSNNPEVGTINSDQRSILTSNGDGVGFSAVYDLPWGVSLGGAYFNSQRTTDQRTQTTAGGDRAEGYTLGLKFDADNLYLAAIFGQTRNATYFSGTNGIVSDDNIGLVAKKANNIEMVAQYNFDFGLTPSLAYVESRGKNLSADDSTGVLGGVNSHALVKYVDVGATYNFNKNMSTYVDYKINLLRNDDFTQTAGLNTDNIVGVGVVYQF